MTAQIVPIGDYELCRCGQGVAVIPVSGGIVCKECFGTLPPKKVPVADTVLVDPDKPPKLDDLLAALIETTP